VSTMETLKTARRRATVSKPGQTVIATKASSLMTREKGKGFTSGLMDVSMKDTIRMDSNTASDFTRLPRELPRDKNGKRERRLRDFIDMYFIIIIYM
jgi:hypothetical protein